MKTTSLVWLFLCMVYGGGILAYEEVSPDHPKAPSSSLQVNETTPPQELPKSIKKAIAKITSYEERYSKAVEKHEKTLEKLETSREENCDNPVTELLLGSHHKRLISFTKRYGNPNHHFPWYEGFRSLPKVGIIYARIAGDLVLIPVPALVAGLPAGLVGTLMCGGKGGAGGFLGGAAVGGAVGKFVSFCTMTPLGGLAGLIAAPIVLPINKIYYKINPEKKTITSHRLANQLMKTGKKIMKQKSETDDQAALNKALQGIFDDLENIKEQGAVSRKTAKFLEKTKAYLKKNFKKNDTMEIENTAKENASSDPQESAEVTPDGKSSTSESDRHLSSHTESHEESE